MDEQAKIELLRQGYDAFKRGDIQRLLGLFSPNIAWVMPEIEGVPFSGMRRGVDQVEEFFRIMDACQVAREFQPDGYLTDGDQVAVFGHCTFVVKSTGVEYSDEWCHLFTIIDGKVTRFQEFSDTHKAALAFQPPAAGIGAAVAAGGTRPVMH